MALPRGISYDIQPTQTLPCKSKIWRFQPQVTTNGFIQQQTQVIFNVSTDYFWDPYTTYLAFQIDISSNPHINDISPGAIWQLDKCGHSFVSMMYITAKGQTEIERIMEYDTLGGIFNDMNYSEWDTHQRFQEGVGSQLDNCIRQSASPGFQTGYYNVTNNPGGLVARMGSNPCRNFDFMAAPIIAATTPYLVLPSSSAQSLSFSATYNLLDYNFSLAPQTKAMKAALALRRYIAASYGVNPVASLITTATTQFNAQYATPWDSFGFDSIASANFSNGTGEFILTSYYNINAIDVGVPSCTVKPMQITINVPLLSGVFGVLVPPENYKLVPTGAFGDLQFYFTLSQYALFSNVDSADPTYRSYKISKIELVTELVQFDQAVSDAIYGVLDNGPIVWNTSSYWLGPLFNLVNGQLPSSIQLNLGFNSLRCLIWCYLANDYQSSTAARKQFRLSMNITSAQINVGTEKYPELPIVGHAGCLFNTKSGNCADFYTNLLRAFDKLHISNDSYSVGMANFCLNYRDWTWTGTERATPTAGNTLNQYNYKEEATRVGKAVFAIDMSSLNFEYGWRTGVNTISKLPFQLDIVSDTSQPYQGSATMYSWCKYDLTLVLMKDSVQVLGRS